MEFTALQWLVLVVAATLVGLAKGGFTAVGTIAVPLAALVMSPVQAAGLLLPVYVVSDAFGVWAWRRSFDRRVLAILIPASLIGIGAGWATAHLVSPRTVGGVIGVIGAVFAARTLFGRSGPAGPPRPARVAPGIFWGALSGFTSFVSHSGAPPYQVYVLPLGMSRAVFAGTTTFLFAAMNAIKLVPYWALGQLRVENFGAMLILSLPAMAAVFAGVRLVRIIPHEVFFRLVTWALLLVSLELMRAAVFQALPGPKTATLSHFFLVQISHGGAGV